MDKKQIIDFASVGGYIRQKKLQEFLDKKFGRQIRIVVSRSHIDFITIVGIPTLTHLLFR